MSSPAHRDATVFAAVAAFDAASGLYHSDSYIEAGDPKSDRLSDSYSASGRALAAVFPTTFEGHAARARSARDSAAAFINNADLEDGFTFLPDGLLVAVINDLANAAPTATSPDGALIAQCDEFADLSRRLAEIYNVEFARDDAGADRAAEPHHQRRDELLELICEAQATTIEGLKARGRMMVAYQDGAECFPSGLWPDSMIDALLRDLTGADGTGEGAA